MLSQLFQLKQIGYLNQLECILLGSFTVMEVNNLEPNISQLMLEITRDTSTPIAKTDKFGHGDDKGCLVIGKLLNLHT